MYLPEATSGPSSVSWSPDGRTLVYLDAGLALEAGRGQHGCLSAHRWPRVRLPTRLVARRQPRGLRVVSWQRRRALDGRCHDGCHSSADDDRRRQRRAAMVTRWPAHRVGLDGAPEPVAHSTWRRSTTTRSAARGGSPPTGTATCPGTTTACTTIISRPRGRPPATRSSSCPTAGISGARAAFWRARVGATDSARQIRDEETTWKARPDWSPDGARVVYSSYLGRQWNQLWLMRADGGDAIQLTYGDYDATAPRWSPDGKRIAYVVNATGNTALRIIDVPGGQIRDVRIMTRHYRSPSGTLRIIVTDSATGRAVPARILGHRIRWPELRARRCVAVRR